MPPSPLLSHVSWDKLAYLRLIFNLEMELIAIQPITSIVIKFK